MTGTTLAIDFGTSNTVAAVRRPDGRTGQVLFDGSPVLPSAVYAESDGTLLVGRDALHAARLAPERFEPNPKQHVDDGTVLLGGDVAVPDLFAAVLARVADDATLVATGIDALVLTHPVNWGTRRRQVLTDAARRAGLPVPTLLAEPVAAARHHLADDGPHPPGPLIVYDLGGGTLDVSVVAGDEVLASDGLVDTGGLDVDAALLAYLAATYHDRDPEAWQRIHRPASAADRRHRRQLLDDLRTAKELLSRSAQTFVHLPLLDVDAPVGREQLEAVSAPLVDRTVRATRAALAAAGLGVPPRATLYLIGGASRMPLVATILHRELKLAPVLSEQPELVVAYGALAATSPRPVSPAGRPLPPVAPDRPVSPAATAAGWPIPVSGPAAAGSAGQASPAGGATVAASPATTGQAQRAAGPAQPGARRVRRWQGDAGVAAERPRAAPGKPPPSRSKAPLGAGLFFVALGVASTIAFAVAVHSDPGTASRQSGSVAGINGMAGAAVWFGMYGVLLPFQPNSKQSVGISAAIAVGYYIFTTMILLSLAG